MLGALVFLGSFDAVAFLGAHRLAIGVFGRVLVVLLPLLIWVPKRQAAHVRDVKDRLTVENDARQTLAQIIGGAGLIVGLSLTKKTLDLTREGQITDRFTKAIAQLGEEGPAKMTLRIGGIYALERIAKGSDKDHWPIMEILTSYVRKEPHCCDVVCPLHPC